LSWKKINDLKKQGDKWFINVREKFLARDGERKIVFQTREREREREIIFRGYEGILIYI